MAKRRPTILVDEQGVEYEYTEVDANRDRRWLDARLGPINRAHERRTGMTDEEAIRIALADPTFSTARPPRPAPASAPEEARVPTRRRRRATGTRA